MIHRIEPGFLRTQDSLSKRERREGRRRQASGDVTHEPAVEHLDDPPQLEEEHVSVTLDLVA